MKETFSELKCMLQTKCLIKINFPKTNMLSDIALSFRYSLTKLVPSSLKFLVFTYLNINITQLLK